MMMPKKVWLAMLGVVLAAGAHGAAQQSRPPGLSPPPAGLRFSGPWRHDAAGAQTRIIGTVIDSRQFPVPKVNVRLRSLDSGIVVQDMVTNDKGEYAFDVTTPGTYLVELVLAGGFIPAISNAATVARYETLYTIVRIPGRWDATDQSVVEVVQAANFVGMSSATTMTAATLTLAVQQNIAPVDPGQDLSPKSPRP